MSDIHAYKSDVNNGRYIYILAGVHGDEVESIYVLKELLANAELWEKINRPTIVVPIVNVDGYRIGTRTNSHGVDLNRNLPASSWSHVITEPQYHPGLTPLSEPENQFLVSLFQKYPPGIAISLHSWRPILNYNGDCIEVAHFLAERNQYPIAPSIGYATPGSLGDYLPEKYSAPVLTYELPRIGHLRTLRDVWDENKLALTDLLTSDLLNKYCLL
ncbi:MAG: succinylglutamate desuccinylase/aspartoacylase family protein [Oligoflexia bacterium]|nr:succinylglutamate desuccinylase/aspartoacylase family protein [Oligoflexia bacterium]MBF0365996.1 succinylglutamate desuccinylase/aspartoacylase family protein [Oligoflexia bacterium]